MPYESLTSIFTNSASYQAKTVDAEATMEIVKILDGFSAPVQKVIMDMSATIDTPAAPKRPGTVDALAARSIFNILQKFTPATTAIIREKVGACMETQKSLLLKPVTV